jgi:hypothetical protein
LEKGLLDNGEGLILERELALEFARVTEARLFPPPAGGKGDKEGREMPQ